MILRAFAAVTVFLAVLCSVAAAADQADTDQVSYYRDIRPIFQEHCYGCHQPAMAKGSLDMTTRAGMLAGGDTEEPSIVAGQPDAGTLMEMITPGGSGKADMPKGKPPLSAVELAKVRSWIEQGAADDSPAAARPRFTADSPPPYRQPPVLTSLDFSPDGSLLAVSAYHEVLLRSADGSKLVGRLVGLSERIESVRFSPNGKLLAVTGGSPGRMGEVQIWDVEKQKLVRSVSVTYDTVYGASWSADGTKVAFGCGDSTLRAIEVKSGEQIFFQSAHNDWVLDSVFSVDASHLVSVSRDRSMKLSVVATERFVDNITSITPGALKGGLHAVDRHPTKDELLVGGADGVPKIYRMHRVKKRKIGDDFNLIRKFAALPGRVYDVSYSGDGALVAAGSSDRGRGAVSVYQEADAKLLAKMEGIEEAIYCVAFHPEGQTLASGGFQGVVFLSDARTGKLINKFVPVPLESE